MTSLNYTGHAIVVQDGGDFGAIAYTGPGDGTAFATDEDAVRWASARMLANTWHYVALTDGTWQEPALTLTAKQKRLLALRMRKALAPVNGVIVHDVEAALVTMLDGIEEA
jgi:hypothetical protein